MGLNATIHCKRCFYYVRREEDKRIIKTRTTGLIRVSAKTVHTVKHICKKLGFALDMKYQRKSDCESFLSQQDALIANKNW